MELLSTKILKMLLPNTVRFYPGRASRQLCRFKKYNFTVEAFVRAVTNSGCKVGYSCCIGNSDHLTLLIKTGNTNKADHLIFSKSRIGGNDGGAKMVVVSQLRKYIFGSKACFTTSCSQFCILLVISISLAALILPINSIHGLMRRLF